ncbi:TRAP transporter small permease [Idiomarina sp.]|uniref:TRAP transporter small permease n=1 Tax=Idiomarina sp. TaxID=1874361 RepID=UPI003A914C88
MNTFKDNCYRLSGWLSGLFIVAITLLLLAQIIGRLFGFIVPSAEDFAGFSLAASTFLGLAYTFREGGHIRVTLVIQQFKHGKRRAQEGVVLSLGLALSGFVAYSCCYMLFESYIYDETSYGYIPVPLWIPQLTVAIGAIALTLAVFDAWLSVIRGDSPNYMKHEDSLSLEE